MSDDGNDEHYWTNSTGDRSRGTWEGLTFEQVCKAFRKNTKTKKAVQIVFVTTYGVESNPCSSIIHANFA